MSIRNPTSFQITCLPIAIAILLIHSGCNLKFEHDPEKTVTIEITGSMTDDERDQIGEILKGMTDGTSHMLTSSWAGEKATIKLSPVFDVEAFSRKINFGKVTEVDGRTVKVEFVK